MNEIATSDAAGHRARMRERLLRHGAETLGDVELVEYLLMLAIPRRDTKPLARRLLREFGDIERLISAPPEALMAMDGVGETVAAAFKIAQGVAIRLLRQRTLEQPVLAGWEALLDYLHADMAHIGIERVRVLHLDRRNRLLRDEVMAEGSVDQAALHVREVIARAIQLGSSALILVHNHPSGDVKPSRQDIALTREVVDAGRPLGITVHDHVIVGGAGHSSMRALGLL
ncbi:RadC family protein [Sphingomonas quercus]|uniref:DNA repair protein RadC n=1 Tax=Sphingomonas quercus TaxID=2842451 RepID=A0ABS6BH26_9SPHN|nr:DNA repair protein RadC [Sphingomonas quercus]MBU3076540.1 DNA repair protein RadC [Sphingomonas quercus]